MEMGRKAVILIFSTTKDYTTFEVIKWLHHFGEHDIVRINADEKKTILFHVQNNSFTLQIDGQVIESSQIKAVWYRKGIDWLGGQFHEVALKEHPRLAAYLNAWWEIYEITSPPRLYKPTAAD